VLTLVQEGLEAYVEARAGEEPPLLAELSRVTAERTRWPEMKISWAQAALMRLLLRVAGARRVLELGTFTGYSALAMAEVLPDDGEIITCDVDETNPAIGRSFWDRSPHGRKISFRLGKASDVLKTLAGPFDAVFIDADKPPYREYYEACLPMVRAGGLILADNTLAGGRVLSPGDDGTRAMAAFNDAVASDPRVESVILTVRDGLTVARKK
jgi:caffeoyl-CoA O-methyltransferase